MAKHAHCNDSLVGCKGAGTPFDEGLKRKTDCVNSRHVQAFIALDFNVH